MSGPAFGAGADLELARMSRRDLRRIKPSGRGDPGSHLTSARTTAVRVKFNGPERAECYGPGTT